MYYIRCLIVCSLRNSLAVQWIGQGAFTVSPGLHSWSGTKDPASPAGQLNIYMYVCIYVVYNHNTFIYRYTVFTLKN